jgi:phage host-nuclease inhibitor protein Gam
MDVNALVETAEATSVASLPEGIEGYEDEQEPSVRGPWQIETLSDADWAFSRVAECEAEAAEIERQAEATIRRVRARAAELTAKAERGAGFFRFKLLEYAEAHRADILHGKKKSRDFLHGRIGWRKAGGGLAVTDKEALGAWLRAQPIESGLYRVKVEPEMAAIQAVFRARGEIPPGCEPKPETETIHIEASAPETALAKE